MRKNVPVTILILILVATIFLTGCQAAQRSSLTDDQVVQAIDNILKAINSADYLGFSKDFSSDLKTAIPEEEFIGLVVVLQRASGKYVSCPAAAPDLSNTEGFAVYRLNCKFDLENVIVQLTYKIGGSQVEGLFFDSTNLRNVK
jgi:hypothetical protein